MCAGKENNSPRIPLYSVLPPDDLFQISHIHITVLLHQVQLVIVVGIAQGVTLGIVLGIGEVVVVVPLTGREGVLVDVVSEEVDGAVRRVRKKLKEKGREVFRVSGCWSGENGRWMGMKVNSLLSGVLEDDDVFLVEDQVELDLLDLARGQGAEGDIDRLFAQREILVVLVLILIFVLIVIVLLGGDSRSANLVRLGLGLVTVDGGRDLGPHLLLKLFDGLVVLLVALQVLRRETLQVVLVIIIRHVLVVLIISVELGGVLRLESDLDDRSGVDIGDLVGERGVGDDKVVADEHGDFGPAGEFEVPQSLSDHFVYRIKLKGSREK
jgi:hypothetical protein